jgi:hypothetical protein
VIILAFFSSKNMYLGISVPVLISISISHANRPGIYFVFARIISPSQPAHSSAALSIPEYITHATAISPFQ